MKSALLSALIFCSWALLAFAVRCHNVRDVLIDGQVYFVDADCYSRMTRARMVAADFGVVVRRHDFENHPFGTVPHTTAPVDYLIVGIKGVLDAGLALRGRAVAEAMHGRTLDLAGALLSPLLGALTGGFLALFARGIVVGWRAAGRHVPGVAWCVPLFWALSPILVHGTLLGRPDHQSLLLALLAVALAAECRLAGKLSRGWGVAAGVSWALALWVSLYEPAVMLAAVVALWIGFNRHGIFGRERLPGWAAFGVISIGTFVLEGWRFQVPAPEMREYLAAWGQSIGELGHLDPRQPTLYRWLGAVCVAAPVLLALAYRHDRRALPAGLLLALLFGLTCWQLRWGYFLALVFVMTLPWQLGELRRWWVVALAVVLSLLPVPQRTGLRWLGEYSMLWEWDGRLDTDSRRARERRVELQLLREVADHLRSEERSPFLAPWWISPALAYWSGQPGVAGSSHQSIAGIADTARFYLAADSADGAAILRARGVAQVVGDEPSRLLSTSTALLDREIPENPLAERLAKSPHAAAPFLVPTFANQFFRVFAVDRAKLQGEGQ